MSCLVLVLFCLVLPCLVLSFVGMAWLGSVPNVTVAPALGVEVAIAPRRLHVSASIFGSDSSSLHFGRENCYTSRFFLHPNPCRVWVLALVRGAKGAAAKTLRRM